MERLERSNSLYKLLSISSVLVFIIWGCKKDAGAPDLGYSYFPDNIGHYVIYQIDSTAKDDRTAFDTTYSFQIKEVIQSIYTDNSGRPTLRLERFRKNYDPLVPYAQQTWTGPHIYAANRTTTTGERVEEDIRYTRIVFPVKKNLHWNANAANTFEAWDSKFITIDQPEIINNLNFDSVATVEEENVINLVETKYTIAKYAKHVGLIYRQMLLISKQPNPVNEPPPFSDTIGLPSYIFLSDKAILYTQKVIGWGN